MVNKREALIEKIRQQGLPSLSGPPPVVSLEDFFEGNDDYSSIGCNLLNHPGPRYFFEHLMRIRSCSNVQGVLVEICEVNESTPDTWPFSECIYILTSASAKQVADWLKPLGPDDIIEGYFRGKPPAAPEPEEGMRVYAAWWD